MSAVLATVIVYKVVLLGIGILAERLNRDASDFFLAGRGMGPWVAGISASASSSSVWTLIGVSGYAFTHGLSAVWLFPACVGGFLINWFVLAPRLRRASARTGSLTVTELLAGGPNAPRAARRAIRAVGSVIILVSLMTYVANQFRGAGTAFEALLGWSATEAILLGAAVVVVYTVLGGFWAVSLTDSIQGLMMAAAALVLPFAAVLHLGGPTELGAALASVEQPPDRPPFAALVPEGGVLAILALLGIALGYPGQPHVVNRIMALRDEAAVARGRTISIAWAVIVYAGMIVLGWCGRIFLERGDVPGLVGDQLIYESATLLLPSIVAGIAIAAVLSAVMSTADSQLLVAASAVEHDLRDRHARPADLSTPAEQRPSSILLARLTVLLLAAAAVVAALLISDRIFGSVLFAWSAIGAAFGPLLLVNLFRGPVAPTGSLLAMTTGFAISVYAYMQPQTKGTVFERVLPFVVAGALAWLFARPTGPDPHPDSARAARPALWEDRAP